MPTDRPDNVPKAQPVRPAPGSPLPTPPITDDAGRRRDASIQDVAAAAGVSTATVSRVLNNPDLVSATTAERVRKAIEQLGYKPNLFAQGLMTRKSHVLGFALPDIFGEFYSELLRGADAEARRQGYHLLVGSESRKPDSAVPNGNLAFRLVDGLAVMITEPNDRILKQAKDLRLPVVLMDLEVDDPTVDCVIVDNKSGAREATEHLLSSVAPARLFFVGGPRENFDTVERAAEFTRVLKAHNHAPGAEQVVFGRYAVEWGYLWAAQQLTKGGPGLRGCAVLAGNDEIALGILQAAQDHKLKVPDELRIVGFDDTRIASLVRPSLSTVRVPLAEVGATAISTLISRLKNPSRAPERVHIPTKLIVRESSDKNAASGGF